jgi:hypothetical protein
MHTFSTLDVVLSLLFLPGFFFCVGAALAWRRAPPTRDAKHIGTLRAQMLEITDELDKLHALLAKKDARETMRGRRANGGGDVRMRPNETAEQWKARMREGVRTGLITPPKLPG